MTNDYLIETLSPEQAFHESSSPKASRYTWALETFGRILQFRNMALYWSSIYSRSPNPNPWYRMSFFYRRIHLTLFTARPYFLFETIIGLFDCEKGSLAPYFWKILWFRHFVTSAFQAPIEHVLGPRTFCKISNFQIFKFLTILWVVKYFCNKNHEWISILTH